MTKLSALKIADPDDYEIVKTFLLWRADCDNFPTIQQYLIDPDSQQFLNRLHAVDISNYPTLIDSFIDNEILQLFISECSEPLSNLDTLDGIHTMKSHNHNIAKNWLNTMKNLIGKHAFIAQTRPVAKSSTLSLFKEQQQDPTERAIAGPSTPRGPIKLN